MSDKSYSWVNHMLAINLFNFYPEPQFTLNHVMWAQPMERFTLLILEYVGNPEEIKRITHAVSRYDIALFEEYPQLLVDRYRELLYAIGE